MPVAAAVVGSTIIGAVASNKASKAQARGARDAANAQAAANAENIAYQERIFEKQSEQMAPWREIGKAALEQIQTGIKDGTYDPGAFKFDFQADPGYEFRKQESINALDTSAAARGKLQSGAQQRQLARYTSGLASQEYDNAFGRALNVYGLEAARKADLFNRQSSLAGVGQVASETTMNARQNTANAVGNSLIRTGNAFADGAIGVANARASGYQGINNAIQGGIGNAFSTGLIS